MTHHIEEITNNAITELDLNNKNVSDEGVKALAKAIETNTSITELWLWNNNIGDEGIEALAKALTHNRSITQVYLGGNKIGDKGVKALAEVLKHNTTITELFLSFNNIGDEGAKALAEVLKHNTIIIRVDLDGNNIGDEGAKAWAAALTYNTSIISLDFNKNNIGAKGQHALEAIQAIIQKNNIRFENKCQAVMDGKFEKFSLHDIQTFMPILDAKISNSDEKEKEEYTGIKHKLIGHFINYIFLILEYNYEAHPLPPEMIAYITSFIVPSDIHLSTPVIAHTNSPQPNIGFVERVEQVSQDTNLCL